MCDQDGFGKLLGRNFIDLSSQNSGCVQIPATARGMNVLWVKDRNGNASGSVTIFEGVAGSAAPWGVMGAPAGTCSVANGPVALQSEQGTFLTIVPTTGAQGILIFEYLSGVIDRKYTSA